MGQIFLASRLSFWQGRYLFWRVFLNPKVSKVKHADNTLWSCRMVLFIDAMVMSMSFLMVCFMDNNAAVVNHELCLYGMPFLLSRIVLLL